MKTKLAIIIVAVSRQFAFAQNLIINGDFSAGNSGFSTDYQFVPSGQSQTPDTFGIRTNTQDFNSSYTSFGDHTTGAGMMMLLDGYPAPDKIAWSETIGVTTNTDYLFSGWTTSADPSNPGTLRFLINGNPPVTDLNLSASAGVWTNFVVAWNSGTNSTASLAIVDQSTISFGNDFALDDLAFVSARPVLALGIERVAPSSVRLFWPTNDPAFGLQFTTNLSGSAWLAASPAPVVLGAENVVTNLISDPQRFYRLFKP